MKVATRTAAASRQVPWAMKGTERNGRAAPPTAKSAASRLGLAAVGGVRRHRLRLAKGLIGLMVGLRDEGCTGQINTGMTQGHTGVRYVFLLPEVREKDWTTGDICCITLAYITSVCIMVSRAATAARGGAPNRRLALGARTPTRRWPRISPHAHTTIPSRCGISGRQKLESGQFVR